MSEGFGELIKETAQTTSGNANDQDPTGDPSFTYELAEKRANEEEEYDKALESAEKKLKG